MATTGTERESRGFSGLNTYTGQWTENEIIHLLKRTMFGAKKQDVDHFKTMTLSDAITELLNPVAPLPAPPLKDYTLDATVQKPDSSIALGDTWVNDANTDGTVNYYRRVAFKKWWMGLMVNQDRSVREKMTLFLHNHFSTETNTIDNANYVYNHHALLRTNALGNFKTLTRAITVDPGMLVYLNGQVNTASAPDENYGRELQELFCCGKGTDSQYTESDVKMAAKVLTGWRNDNTKFSSYFTASRHDTTTKQFSAFYQNKTIAGRSGATAGDLEVNDLMDMIFSTNEVAKYVCRRIYRWFLYYEIDAAIEANIITPLANIFRTNNYELKPVLSALLSSEHFFDPAMMSAQIKSPVDLVVGMCRELNVQFQPDTDYASNYGLWNFLVNSIANMQQDIGDPPDVSGWKSYYQSPQFYEIWINSDTYPKRVQFTDFLCFTGYTFNGKKIQVDGIAFAETLSNPGDPNVLLNDVLKYLYRIDLSDTSKAQIKKDILLGGQITDGYWTDIWNLYISQPTNTANTTLVRNRLRDLFKYFMDLSEFQLI
jgi:uncharacterized protein (DUF1800 family)